MAGSASPGGGLLPLLFWGCRFSFSYSLHATRRRRSRGGPRQPARGAMIGAGEGKGEVEGAAAMVTSASSSGADDAGPLPLRGCCRSSLRSLDAAHRGRSRGGPRRLARGAMIRAGEGQWEVEVAGAAATVTSASSSGAGADPLPLRGCRSSLHSLDAARRGRSRGGPRALARSATIRAGDGEVEGAAATATSASSSGADGRGPLRPRGCPSSAASSRQAARRSPRGARDATIPAGAGEGAAPGPSEAP